MLSNGSVVVFKLYLYILWISASTSIKNDFRYISYKDLQPTVTKFAFEGNTSYSQMLFDVSRNQIFLGVRDGLYRLSLSRLKFLEYSPWLPSDEKQRACSFKGQSEEDCHNYIKILLSDGRHILACGTNAFSPQCSWREIDNISNITKIEDGIAKCPYNPSANITAFLSQNGGYYFGGPTDFSGSDSLISKSFENITLRTKQYNSFWLNEPQFVGSFESEKYVYFLFREAAVEYMNCGKSIYSRIARVCKSDQGGGHIMFKDNWTTFIKARLNCSVSGDYPFYFNEIQSMSYLSAANIVYATFTTPSNSIAGSAICAFNLTAINEAFNGPFKYQPDMNSAWVKHNNPHIDHYNCNLALKGNYLIETSKYQLMDSAVQPTSLNPIHVTTLERFSHITVDILETKHGIAHVLYVAVLGGLIKKISLIPPYKDSCIVEIWQVVPDINIPIRNMQFIKETNAIYITTNQGLYQFPSSHCNRYISKDNCKNAIDPYCGWNERDETCTTAPDGDPYNRFWKQQIHSCAVLDTPVDGGWSAWSEWAPCYHRIFSDTDPFDQCLCQTRDCNNPVPANGGKECIGPSVAVSNCTVHGAWSDWSAWSACSATCGTAVKMRFRTCTNPAPAFGGRVCVGQDRSEAFCTEYPPCPTPSVDGGWGHWSPWSGCTANCSGGYKIRQRKCDNPTPFNGGQYCKGNDIEYERCGDELCVEQKKVHTTDWIIDSNISSKTYHKRRYKISCKAPVKYSHQIKISIRDEGQYCHNQQCNQDDPDYSDWSAWGSWNECSVNCGGGIQTRKRHCKSRAGNCIGESIQTRDCNLHDCKDSWGCWTDWTPCNASCGWGIKIRTRVCLGYSCVGPSKEQQPCENQPCEEVLMDQQLEQPTCVSVGFSFFFIGAIVGLLPSLLYLSYYLFRKKRNIIPSSPHYIAAEQNPYIPVPTREKVYKKHSSPSTGLYALNGTVKSVKCYADDYEIPTMTLKRNSHEVRNGHSKQYESDKYLYD